MMAALIATVKAYRKAGRAVVTVIRGEHKRRYVVSLKRYHALREWTLCQRQWKSSGSWLRGSLTAYLWDRETNAARSEA